MELLGLIPPVLHHAKPLTGQKQGLLPAKKLAFSFSSNLYRLTLQPIITHTQGVSWVVGRAHPQSAPLTLYTGPIGTNAGYFIDAWPGYQIAPQSKALETNGMCGCAVLIIQQHPDRGEIENPLKKTLRHMMVHLNPPVNGTWNKRMLHQLLDSLNNEDGWSLKTSRLTVMPGISSQSEDTIRQIQDVLHERDPELLGRLEYVHYPPEITNWLNWGTVNPALKKTLSPSVLLAHSTSVVSYQGKLFWRPTPADESGFKIQCRRLDHVFRSV